MITRKYYLNHLNYLSSLLLWTVFFDIPNIMSDMIENWSNDFDFKSKCSESSHYLFSFDIERWIICDVDDEETRNYDTLWSVTTICLLKSPANVGATVENLYKVNDSIWYFRYIHSNLLNHMHCCLNGRIEWESVDFASNVNLFSFKWKSSRYVYINLCYIIEFQSFLTAALCTHRLKIWMWLIALLIERKKCKKNVTVKWFIDRFTLKN